MGSKGKSVIFSLIVLIIVAMSVLLPYQAQLYKDRQILGLPHFQEKPLPEELPALSMPARLRLLSEDKVNTASVGKYSAEEIKTRCAAELQILYDKEILPQEFTAMPWAEITAVASLLLDAENVNQGMVLWTLTFSAANAYLQCGLDDETGKILYLYMADDTGTATALPNHWLEGLASYLGLEATAEDELLSTSTLTNVSLPRGDHIERDYRYVFSLDGEQIAYHVGQTQQGVFYGHNLLMPTYKITVKKFERL